MWPIALALGKIFILLFAMVDPFGDVPLFLGVTPNDTDSERRRMARRACIISFLVLTFFALAGRWFLQLFNIEVPAFQVAGGIVLAMVALPMLAALRGGNRMRENEEAEGATKEDVSIIPLTFPILAGPGAITSVLVLSQQYALPGPRLMVIGCAGLTMLISYFILAASSRIARRLGTTGLNVLTRAMGLIVMVIAVQFVLSGIKAFFLIK